VVGEVVGVDAIADSLKSMLRRPPSDRPPETLGSTAKKHLNESCSLRPWKSQPESVYQTALELCLESSLMLLARML